MYIVRLLRGEHIGDTDRFHDDRASAIRRANALLDPRSHVDRGATRGGRPRLLPGGGQVLVLLAVGFGVYSGQVAVKAEDVVLVVPVFAKQRGTRAGYLLGLDDGQETHKLVGSIVHLASGKTYRVDSGRGRVSFEINQALKGDV